MIITAESLEADLLKLKREGKPRKGVSTGIADLDECMLLNKQMLMVLTGLAGRGKSEVLDMIAVNSAMLHDWKWLYFSPETPFVEHLEKIVEKKLGNRLFNSTDAQVKEAVAWANDHFNWIKSTEKFKPADLQAEVEDFIQMGNHVDAIVYDPWNELDHSAQSMRDDQYISSVLTNMRIFHKKYNLLTCVVIHSRSEGKDKDGNVPIPTLFSCNGGMMWANKADYGICVHRPNMLEHGVDVYCQKVKSKRIGRVGKVSLDYDVVSGRFKGKNDYSYDLPVDCPL